MRKLFVIMAFMVMEVAWLHIIIRIAPWNRKWKNLSYGKSFRFPMGFLISSIIL